MRKAMKVYSKFLKTLKNKPHKKWRLHINTTIE
jgi:hypothetical protein